MRIFTMYRRGERPATHTEEQYNNPALPQFQGVIFEDGTVAIRWLTAKKSTSVWASLDDLLAVHGHPEYESELVFHPTGVSYAPQGKVELINTPLPEATC